jgi:hypothetical protein
LRPLSLAPSSLPGCGQATEWLEYRNPEGGAEQPISTGDVNVIARAGDALPPADHFRRHVPARTALNGNATIRPASMMIVRFSVPTDRIGAHFCKKPGLDALI